MTFASTRPAMRRQFKTRKSRAQRQHPFWAFINAHCFESAFQVGKAQEVGSSGEGKFTRQVEISKVLCTSTQTVQMKMRGEMPLCLFDCKGVFGVWRGLVACSWCSMWMKGWVIDTHIVLGHTLVQNLTLCSQKAKKSVLIFDSINNVISRSLV